MVSFMIRPLYLWGKSPQYPLDRLGGTLAGLDVEKRKLLNLLRLEL
jgi:hypothetical protein